MSISRQPFSSGRRSFLWTSSALVAAALGNSAVAAATGEAVMLRPDPNRDLFRVRIELDVKGNVNVPKNSLVSRKSDLKLPIESNAVFDYEERFRRPAHSDPQSPVTLAERFYHEAQQQSQLNRTASRCELRQSVRQSVVRREMLPEVIYSNEDYFERDELELLRVPVSSVAVDQLLPTAAVRAGDRYEPSKEALVSVLNLTSVDASDVSAEVVTVDAKEARIQFRGKVDGSVEGVPTVLRVVGKLTFDRAAGACSWLAMAIHETREIGKAEPGFDVAATIKMVRQPLAQPIALDAVPPKLDITGAIPADRLYVELTSDELGISALMDRRWRMMRDVPGAAMMRMIEHDRSIAQCDFRPLVSLEPGVQWTLEALQQDVKRTLGEQFAEFIEAEERLSETGLRVLRVAATGAVQGVPIQWVISHFSDDTGRRVLATFTMEGDHVPAFAGSDLQLTSSLRLIPRTDAGGVADAATSTQKTRVAGAKVDQKSADRVQSASDLK